MFAFRSQVRFPPWACGIFLHHVTFGGSVWVCGLCFGNQDGMSRNNSVVLSRFVVRGDRDSRANLMPIYRAPPPSGSAHALHLPVSKSRANVLLIFQCPGICPTPSQVDILVSDDSLAFCPTMFYRIFSWVETRVKSELRVK